MKASSQEPMVKTLSEREIQDRLYGLYLNRRPENPPREKPAAVPTRSPDVDWTGAEILQGELAHLRSELIVLRKERDRLIQEMDRSSPKSPRTFLWKRVGILLLILSAGYPLGAKFLSASPAAMEPTPYTIQVAVYEARSIAEQALQLLRELDCPAFLVESVSRSGKKQFRIYVGQFVTKTEAQIEKDRLLSDPRFADAFVRIR